MIETEVYLWVLMVSLMSASCQPNQWILKFCRIWALEENCPWPSPEVLVACWVSQMSKIWIPGV